MRLTSAFGRPTSYLDELPEGSSRARVGSLSFICLALSGCATSCGRNMSLGVLA